MRVAVEIDMLYVPSVGYGCHFGLGLFVPEENIQE